MLPYNLSRKIKKAISYESIIRNIFIRSIILSSFLIVYLPSSGMSQSIDADTPLDSTRYRINRLASDQPADETRIVIDGGSTVRIEITSLIGTIQTSLITPGGMIVTPQNVTNFGGKFTLIEGGGPSTPGDSFLILPQINQNYHYIYEFPLQDEGEYRIKFQAPVGLNQEVAILTEIKWNSDIVVKLIPTDASPIIGRPTIISMVVIRGTQPITGADVQLSIRNQNGAKTMLSLLDNGDGQTDDRVGDGVYSGEFTPQVAGNYSLVGIATGIISGKKSFTRNSLASFVVRAASSQFTGTIANQGVDDNGDGLFDRIQFRLGTQTATAGQYQAFVELKTAGGKTMIGNGVANLAAGTSEIIANVPASAVLEANENGPYTIENIRLDQITAADGSQEIDRRTNLGQTLPYQLSQFQRPPLILTGVFTETGIDTNGNGKFDILRVSVQVNVLIPGLYDWNMKIANSDSQDISFASARGNLTGGLNNITVDFNGAQIRRSESNGPYSITDLLLFGPKSIVATEVGQTRAYSFTEFEEGGPNVSIGLSPTNVGNLRIGQPHTVNVTVNQGSAPVSSRIVTLRILSGPNAGLLASKTTDAAGKASFTYTGNVVGTDTLRASVTVDDFLFNSTTASATWIDNSAPLCTQASPSLSLISPPDNRLVTVNILGLSDPDGDSVFASVISVRQDEPTNHLGASPNTPDAVIQNGVVSVKAERIFGTVQVNGTTYIGNGRVYHIAFTADDGRGGQCSGTVLVGVPHVKTATPIDGGALFDSTIP